MELTAILWDMMSTWLGGDAGKGSTRAHQVVLGRDGVRGQWKDSTLLHCCSKMNIFNLWERERNLWPVATLG